MRKNLMTATKSLLYGNSYDLPDEQADEFLRKGLAIPDKSHSIKTKETATSKKVTEKATAEQKPKPRTRRKK